MLAGTKQPVGRKRGLVHKVLPRAGLVMLSTIPAAIHAGLAASKQDCALWVRSQSVYPLKWVFARGMRQATIDVGCVPDFLLTALVQPQYASLVSCLQNLRDP